MSGCVIFRFIFSSMLSSVKRTLAAHLPSQCRICHAWPTETLCQACLDEFARPRHRCATCALILSQGAMRCGACLRRPGLLHECRAAVSYEFPWTRIILDFKFESEPALARALGDLMLAQQDIRRMVESASALVPVPLSPARLCERGYNQAMWLCRALSV